MSDLRSLKVAATGFLHLRDSNDDLLYAEGPDGQPDKNKPVGITLYSPGSKPYSKAYAAKHARMMEKVKRKGKLTQTAAEIAAENAEFLTAITVEFHHIERDELQGEALFRATYEDLEIGFIAEQANTFAGEWANFPKGSAKPSASTSDN